MNLLHGRIERNGAAVTCFVGECRPPAPPALADLDGAEVAAGLRPEILLDTTHAAPDAPRLKGRVRFVELLGAERLVQIELSARPIADDAVAEVARDVDAAAGELLREARVDRALLTARFDAHAMIDAGDLAEVAVAPELLHFFDLVTGRAIRAAIGVPRHLHPPRGREPASLPRWTAARCDVCGRLCYLSRRDEH